VSGELFGAVVLFATVASFTPGPNNTMLMASGANFGLARTVPHMVGVVTGFVLLLLCIGLGLGGLFAAFPRLQDVLQIGGAAYLLYLAWKLASAKGLADGVAGERPQTFWQAFAFQWINPKAWTSGISVFAAYAPKSGYTGAVLIIAAPAIAALMRHPGGLVIGLVAAILVNLSAVVMHVVTLPVEFDASFNRALVVLEQGRFVPKEELGAARHILSAAAYTYVAAALVDLINLPRLLRGLRF